VGLDKIKVETYLLNIWKARTPNTNIKKIYRRAKHFNKRDKEYNIKIRKTIKMDRHLIEVFDM